MTYTNATDKSDRDLVSYQSVRGAEVRAVYNAITEQTSMSQIHRDFVRPSDDTRTKPIDYTVDFLCALDLCDRPSTRLVERIEGQPFSDLPFELRVFHHLKQQSGPQDHFARVHEVIASTDTVFYDKDNLLEDLKRELDDYPFDWNIEKVQTWYNLMEPFGLVSVRDNQEVLTSPAPGVVYDLLEAFSERDGSVRLVEALDWIEENFFSCYASRGGRPRVHIGLSQTLATMIEDGCLELRAVSDATREVEVPSLSADKVSRFELDERPQTPAYEYPLSANELEVSQ